MSDFVRVKCVRYPLSNIGINNISDIEDRVDDFRNRENRKITDETGFTITMTRRSDWYLDFVVLYEYGGDDNEYIKSRYCTPNEMTKYTPLFEQIVDDFAATLLKVVEYFYYNATEPPDVYNEADDDFYNEV